MPAPDMVILWRVYEHCNLGCHFCCYSKLISRPRTIVDVDTIVQFGHILNDYRQHYPRTILVSWLGGEPLLWPKLPNIARLYKQGYGLQLGITTNGAPLQSPEIRQLLVREFDQVTISIDGIGDVHDQARETPGLYEQLKHHIEALRRDADAVGSSVLLKVNTILMRGNIEQFADLCHEVARWGIRELTFNQLGGNDRPEYYPDHRLLPAQVERFVRELPQLRAQLATQGLLIHGSERYLQRIISTTNNERVPVSECHPGAWFIFIDEQGRMAPCSFTPAHYGIPLATITDMEALHGLPRRFAEQRALHRAAPCEDCHSTQVFDKFALGANSPTA